MFKNFIVSGLLLTAGMCHAGNPDADKPFQHIVPEVVDTSSWGVPPTMLPLEDDYWLFDPHEFQLELGWTKMDNESKAENRAHNDEENDGFVIGAHYYATRHLSLGLDFIHTDGFSTENVIAGVVKARIPVDECALAIILLAGGGASFGGEESGGVYEVGAGVEVRILEHVSLTMDYRVMGPESEIQAFRAGVTFVF